MDESQAQARTGFAGLPLMTEYVDGRTWRVLSPVYRPVTYRPSMLAVIDAGYRDLFILDGALRVPTVVVPHLYVSDWASIPRLFWRLLPPAGDGPDSAWGPAAVIHDVLYSGAGGVKVTRAQGDAVFDLAMRDLAVTDWKRVAMYKGVRVGGWVAWRRYRQEAEGKRMPAKLKVMERVERDVQP